MGGVALRRAEGAGIALGGVVVGGLVHLQPQVRDDARPALVGDVDDARGADGVRVAGRVRRRLRVLVELEHVGLARSRERDRVLGDRGVLPAQAADLARLRVGLARLDLARIEDQHVAAGGIGDVGAVAVVAQRHAVRQDVSVPDRVRRLWIGDVDRGDRLHRGARRVERLAVWRET